MKTIELHINGVQRSLDTDPERTLLSVLRDDFDLTGAKYGCGEGQCGACTVLVDGQPMRSCQVRVDAVTGKQITTIEGLAKNGQLHPLQQAFLELDAMQCGYCTPGMILSGVALLANNANPSETEIARFMNGNLCRCGVYSRIIAAIRRAAQAMRGGAR
jgi:aerobic-type carbon monoxide dehydrogenase small subunit (CoxS/CutS family)